MYGYVMGLALICFEAGFSLLVSDEMKLTRERTKLPEKIIVSKNDLEHSDI